MNAICRNDDEPECADAPEAGYDDLNDAWRCQRFLAQFELSDDFDIELSNEMLKSSYLPYCKAFSDYVMLCGRTGEQWTANDFIGYHDGKTDYKALAQVIAGMYGTKLYDAYKEYVEADMADDKAEHQDYLKVSAALERAA